MSETSKSVAELEGKRWSRPSPDLSPFHRHVYEAVSKPLSALNSADLRVLISQDIGLKFIMPLALAIVEQDLLIEVAHFKGDLLASMLSASQRFYMEHADVRLRVERIVEKIPSELDKLDHIDFDTTSEAIEEALADFRRHHHPQ